MKNRIGRVLFKRIFVWYITIAILLSILQIWNEYKNERIQLDTSLDSISKTFYAPLVDAVWNLDERQIKYNINSIVSMNSIIGISIIDPENTVISQSGTVDHFEMNYVNYLYEKEDVIYKSGLIKKTFELESEGGLNEIFGRVTMYASSDTIMNNMKEQIFIIIMNAMIKSLALLILLLIFTNKLITVPLNKLIHAINKTNQKQYEQVDLDILPCGSDTELPLLFESYNRMQERIEEEVGKNKAFQSFFDGSSDALAVVDDGIITECNKTAMTMMRVRDKKKIIGFRPGELSPGYQPDGERSEVKADRLIHLALTKGTQKFDWTHIGTDKKKTWLEITLTPISLKDRDVIYASLRDITVRKKAETSILAHKNRLHRLANNDPLTGLPNRMYFSEQLEQAMSKAKRHETMLAVLFIDLDRFKPINDSLGHFIGDKVLQEVATRLQVNIRKEDTLARLGGDEFVILMENLVYENNPSILAQKILDALREPIYIDDHILYVSGSIGISLYPKDDGSVHNLIKYADAAMYKAKAEGRNNYQYYSSDLTEIARLRVSLEADLREALKNEEFIVHYQPQVDAKNEALIGMEALVRWSPSEEIMNSPSKFIALANETGLIVEIDRWVMKEALAQIAQWYKLGLNPGVLSLNISMKQLQNENCMPFLKKTLKETECKPEWISFEVTESHIMSHPEQAIETLNKLHDLGIKVAIDDFGTGYSSLSYLKRLPIDKLKIDKSFVKDLPENEEDVGIVKAIIALSKSLNIDVIAEGVETNEQKLFLLEHGCDDIQGFIYGKPMPSTKMEELLKGTNT